MKLSQYLTNNYEEFYYDLYLRKLEEKYGMNIPEKEEYLNKIHSPKPKCIEDIQEKYYKGCKQSSKFTNNKDDIEFYNYMKKISKDSISDFVSKNDIIMYKTGIDSNKFDYLALDDETILRNKDKPELQRKTVAMINLNHYLKIKRKLLQKCKNLRNSFSNSK